MKPLLNTLYITQPDVYLALQGENILVRKEDDIIARFPLHNLESIVVFSYLGVSPRLMESCVEKGISLCFINQIGRFSARVTGPSRGNVLLRKTQYAQCADDSACLTISKNIILAKIHNEKWTLERYLRQYPLRVDQAALKNTSQLLSERLQCVRDCNNMASLRGHEGTAQVIYFSVFNEMILNQKKDFSFLCRNRRPPTDPINCLLSFAYTLLANDTASALETVGLDAYVGFMHQDRPGRESLALDLMEEFRAPYADRFVLSLINRAQLKAKDFDYQDNGAVRLKDEARKTFLQAWQSRKQESLTHPYLDEKISWGLIPYAQAMLMARYLRGDLEAYPPFFWR